MKTFRLLCLSFFVLAFGNAQKTENGLITKESPYSVDATYTKLRSLLENNPNLNILFELDHSKNAASVDLELPPTRIILFGNPKLGTPLMQASPSTAIDLPQKILVYTDGEGTKIAYNDPMYLQQRHGIEGKNAILEKVSKALQTITDRVIAE